MNNLFETFQRLGVRSEEPQDCPLPQPASLIALPTELILGIASLLRPHDAAAFSLSSRRFYGVLLGFSPGLLKALTKREHSILYSRLAKDMGSPFLFCGECSNIHSTTRWMRCMADLRT